MKSLFGYEAISSGWTSRPEKWFSYSWLITAIPDWCSENEMIYFIPFGILYNLPLHCLHLPSKRHLIERNPVAYCHSLSLLFYLLKQESTHSVSVYAASAVFGNPQGDLPGSEKEILFVAGLFHTKALLESQATKTTFLESYTKSSFLHFAGHGSFSGLSGFQHLFL